MNRKLIHTVFEGAVRVFPSRTAVVHGDESVTYLALNSSADRIAGLLRDAGVGKDVIVGILPETGIDYVASLLGVMKAGGIALPIDLALPAGRLSYILEKTPPAIMICGRGQKETLSGAMEAAGLNRDSFRRVELDRGIHQENCPDLSPGTGRGPCTDPDPDDACYIMYTSGSTGLPKAIVGCHKSLSHFIHWEVKEFSLDEQVRVTQFAPVTFDASLRDIFVPLITGGTLCIPTKEVRSSVKSLVDWVDSSGITLVHCVPSLFRAVTKEISERNESDGIFSSLKYILMAGEALYGRDLLRWMDLVGDRIVLVNLYGASETTLVKTFHRITARPATPNMIIPAGQPISNTAVLVIKGGRLCDVGEIGDIYIKTPFRTKGYYNDTALTAESFVQNPLNTDKEDIIYRTGDIGRYLPDRSLEFIGRLDAQVKVNGVRIELAEIETALRGLGCIDQAIVVASRNSEGENVLVCYYTGKKEAGVSEISDHLGKMLPFYMLPSFYVKLDEFPLGINGKIDRKALPKPEEMIYAQVGYEPPSGETEEKLAGIWGEVLNIKKVGVQSPFFQIGGHSLTATRVISRIYKVLGAEVSLKEFFGNSTIRRLAACIDARKVTGFSGIRPVAPGPDYELSPSQRRLWILDRIEGGTSAYSLPQAYVIEGPLDIPVFRKSLQALVVRHESLRTIFVSASGEPRQRILDAGEAAGEFVMEESDLRNEADAAAIAMELAAREAAIPFDLTRGPLMRVKLLTVADGRFVVLLNLHHIVTDAWSLDIMAEEIFALYYAYLGGNGTVLKPLTIQYKDYAAWQNERLKSREMLRMAAYWKENLSGDLPVLDIASDFPRPRVLSYQGKTISLLLDGKTSSSLEALAGRMNASMFMLLLSALKILLYRYTGQEDIIVGTPVSGRDHPDLENQVGFFVNTLALRDNVSGADSLLSMLEKIKRTTISAYDNQAYPFDILVDELGLSRDPGRPPLFDVMLVYRDDLRAGEDAGPLKVSLLPTDPGMSRFDMTFEIVRETRGLRVALNFRTDLFREDTARRMAGHFRAIVEAALADPSAPVTALRMIGEEESRMLFEAAYGPADIAPLEGTIVDLFDAEAERRASHVAVVCGDRELTYLELKNRASSLASFLVAEYGAGREEVIGLMADRSEWSVIGLLGIMMSGCAYLPIDPSGPSERLAFMLKDSGCRLVLSCDGLRLPDDAPGAANLPDIRSIEEVCAGGYPALPAGRRPSAGGLAYIIYTSGSTGEPKGVLTEHRSFVNMSREQIRLFGISETDRVLQFASSSFDASLSEIFMTLFSGATLVIADRETINDPALFTGYLTDRQVSVATLPPGYLKTLSRDSLPTLRTLITAGEPPPAEEALYYCRRKNYFNAYGPTETSVCATVFRLSSGDDYSHVIPIGKPLANTAVFILDEGLSLVPFGVPGEICISGMGIARGYLNRPALTAGKFVESPFAAGERIYRSGDLGRLLPDGNVEFLGRKDDQVKIRGYRIEPGEVRSALIKHPSVVDAVVIPWGSPPTALAAYVVSSGSLDTGELRAHLAAVLPPHMIPAFIVPVESIPMTSHGKIDRKALPPPGISAPVTEYVPPRTDQERKVADLWQEVLGRESVGCNDNFFELGGNSLKSVQLVSMMLEELGIPVPVKLLYLYPTIAGLLRALAERGGPCAAATGLGAGHSGTGHSVSPFLAIERRPLARLFGSGEMKPVSAAALMCLSDDLCRQTALSREDIVRKWCGGRPVISSVTETPLGRVASIVLPRFPSELYRDKEGLLALILDAMGTAGRIGAKTVSLTGLLPAATNFGRDIIEALPADTGLPRVTTGEATVAAAMLLTIERILGEAGRSLDQESVGFLGLDSVGTAVLELMLRCLPHPGRIMIHYPYGNGETSGTEGLQIGRQSGFLGEFKEMKHGPDVQDEFYEASLIIGATNAPGIIDISRVMPGGLVVGESGLHCFHAGEAAARMSEKGDILYTEGDMLRLPSPSACTIYMPEEIEGFLAKGGRENFLDYRPERITGCVLSGLLSDVSPDLLPTTGRVSPDSCHSHYQALKRLGFEAADLHARDEVLSVRSIGRFLGKFGGKTVSVRETR